MHKVKELADLKKYLHGLHFSKIPSFNAWSGSGYFYIKSNSMV